MLTDEQRLALLCDIYGTATVAQKELLRRSREIETLHKAQVHRFRADEVGVQTKAADGLGPSNWDVPTIYDDAMGHGGTGNEYVDELVAQRRQAMAELQAAVDDDADADVLRALLDRVIEISDELVEALEDDEGDDGEAAGDDQRHGKDGRGDYAGSVNRLS